jgi:hypothetical protein
MRRRNCDDECEFNVPPTSLFLAARFNSSPRAAAGWARDARCRHRSDDGGNGLAQRCVEQLHKGKHRFFDILNVSPIRRTSTFATDRRRCAKTVAIL